MTAVQSSTAIPVEPRHLPVGPRRSGAPQRNTRGITPTGAVAGTFAVILAVLGGTSLCAVRDAPPALRFFDPRRSPTFDETCLVSTIDYAISSDERNDVVFLGDSVCRTGLDPIQFEHLTGLHAYNLGIVGDLGPGVMLNIARAYLAKHPKPRLFVLCVSPLGLERDVPWYWVKLRDHFVNCYGFDTHDFRAQAASTGYTIRQGTVLAWDSTMPALSGLCEDVRDKSLIGMEQVTYRQYENLTREKRGHFELPGRGPDKNLDRPGGLVRVHDTWDAGVRRLAETCDSAGVPLMIRFGPVSAASTKNLKFERLERWVQELQASCPHLIAPSDQSIVRFPPELCWDYSHPNPQGAKRFTEQVAAEVRSALASAGNDRDR
jgi:hypothetical protein